MRFLRLTLAYDGTAYAGWQVQPGQPTVQQALEDAIEKVTGQRTRVLASGRTDAGVHALGQVVGWRTESHLTNEVLRRALNAELPRDIAISDVADAPEGFHAIRDALRKRYRYVIHDGSIRDVFALGYCWHYRHGQLDVPAMQRAARCLVGKHDFASFQTTGSERESTVRTVFDLSIDRKRLGQSRAGQGIARKGDCLVLEIEADGFLYNMVRAIVGTLVEVGRGAQPESWVEQVLNATDRRKAGPNAPPEGLYLVWVEYERKAES